MCVCERYCALDAMGSVGISPLANGYIFTNDLNYFLCVSWALDASMCA